VSQLNPVHPLTSYFSKIGYVLILRAYCAPKCSLTEQSFLGHRSTGATSNLGVGLYFANSLAVVKLNVFCRATPDVPTSNFNALFLLLLVPNNSSKSKDLCDISYMIKFLR
jgi:hypothetical protein